MRKRFWIIIPLLLLIIILCCWFFIPKPRDIFQRKFYFELPKSAKIESQSYNLYYDCLEMKVRFESDDYPVILAGIEKFGEIRRQQGKGLGERDKDDSSFRGTLARSGEEFVAGYGAVEQGMYEAKTRTIKILITQDKTNPDQYFLYVRY